MAAATDNRPPSGEDGYSDDGYSDDGYMGASNLWSVLDQSNQMQVLECERKDKEALAAKTEQGD